MPPAGRVHRVNAKARRSGERGLPKPPVTEAEVTPTGIAGDFNVHRHTKKGDDPDRALLLIPRETLAQLNAEGWPVQPGDVGENLTLEGIPYDAMPPGTRLRVGGEVEIEVTKACDPCTFLYGLPYVGPARGPAFLKATLGRRGWYARVLRAGRVRAGDAVEIV